jgi:hypothetical protein
MNIHEAIEALDDGKVVEWSLNGGEAWYKFDYDQAFTVQQLVDAGYRIAPSLTDSLAELPVGTVVEMKDKSKMYFINADADPRVCCCSSAKLPTGGHGIKNIKQVADIVGLAESEWKPVMDGKQPVPDWVRVEIVNTCSLGRANVRAADLNWGAIRAYRILKQKIPR